MNSVLQSVLSAPPESGPAADFMWDLQQALRAPVKSISPKHFYDTRGSALFDRICDLPEYYPTRTEMAILRHHAGDIAARMGADAELVEFGAGSLRKVRILLQAMTRPARYVPVDISGAHLRAAARALQADFAALPIAPVEADYTRRWELPQPLHAGGRRVGFFPGSTIGNFSRAEAAAFLRECAVNLAGGALLLGADLIKSPAVLHAAYNDAQGVTAAFNLNLLERANRELGCDFALERFDHCAFYNAPQQRIEMHLVSTHRQSVRVGGEVYAFRAGETLHTENSCKFTIDGLHELAVSAGMVPGPVWTDAQGWFGLIWLDIPEPGVNKT